MFAHQVVEYLINNNPVVDPNFQKELVYNIRKSQKFHFGSSVELSQLFKSSVGKEVFTVDSQFLKLPYKMCWFDYKNDSFCRAFFIWEQDNCIRYFLFLKTNECGWVIYPFAMSKEVGVANGKVESMRICDAPGFRLTNEEFGYISIDLSIIEFSLKLLNCRNITTETVTAPEKLNKKRRKNGKQEIFDYHVLNISVPSNKKEYGNDDNGEHSYHVRLHLCRGHFKQYTSERPLLGRFVGLYWWQPHIRGKNKSGMVVKNYNVKIAADVKSESQPRINF